MLPGDEAGLCAFQSRNARIGVRVSPEGERQLVLHEHHRDSVGVNKEGRTVFEDRDSDIAVLPMAGDRVWLRIRYVFTPQEAGETEDTAFFSYSFDGAAWTEFPYALEMKYTLDYFTGYRSALYNFATVPSGPSVGFADFDYFHQRVE